MDVVAFSTNSPWWRRAARILCAALACLAALCSANSAQAQYFAAEAPPEPFSDQNTSAVIRLGSKESHVHGGYLNTGYFGPYLHMRHIAGDGVGYHDNGYTNFGVFWPKAAPGGIVYIDTRLGVTNEGDLVGNAGTGYRYFFPRWNRLFGANFFYDADDGHQHFFQQIGFGIESRGENWDFFANGYIPMGRDVRQRNQVNIQTAPTFTEFSGNFFNLTTPTRIFREFEAPNYGFDVEFGGPLPVVGNRFGIRGYLGYYSFDSDYTEQLDGLRYRMQAELTDNMTGHFLLTRDGEFGTSVLLGFEWQFPGSGVHRNATRHLGPLRNRGVVVRGQDPEIVSESQRYRMFEIAQRNERVVVHRSNTVEDVLLTEAARDAETGRIIRVIHVDGNAAVNGDGTVEAPFNNLASAEAGSRPFDIILLYQDSQFTNQSIALQNEQRLLGEKDGRMFNTLQLGLVDVPRVSMGTQLAVIENPGGNAVTLAPGVEVSGLVIQNSNNAIFADGVMNQPDQLIDLNMLQLNNNTTAINLMNSRGPVLVTSTDIMGGVNGVNIDNVTRPVNFASDVTISDTTGTAFRVTGGDARTDVLYVGSIDATQGNGVEVEGTPANSRVRVIADSFTHSGAGTGVLLTNVDGQVGVANAELRGDTGVSIMDGAGQLSFINVDMIDNTTVALQVTGGSARTQFDENSSISLTDSGGRAVDISMMTGGGVTFDPGSSITALGNSSGIRIMGLMGDAAFNFGGDVQLGNAMNPITLTANEAGTNGEAVFVDHANFNAATTFNNLNIVTTGLQGVDAQNGGTIGTLTGSIVTEGTNASGVEISDINMDITLNTISVAANSELGMNADNEGLDFVNATGRFRVLNGTIIGNANDPTEAIGRGIDIDGGGADYFFGGDTDIYNRNAHGIRIVNQNGSRVIVENAFINERFGGTDEAIIVSDHNGDVTFNFIDIADSGGDALTFNNINGDVTVGAALIGTPGGMQDVTGRGVQIVGIDGSGDFGLIAVADTGEQGLFTADNRGTFTFGDIVIDNAGTTGASSIQMANDNMLGATYNFDGDVTITNRNGIGLEADDLNANTVVTFTGDVLIDTPVGGNMTNGIDLDDIEADMAFNGLTTVNASGGAGILVTQTTMDSVVTFDNVMITDPMGNGIELIANEGDTLINGGTITSMAGMNNAIFVNNTTGDVTIANTVINGFETGILIDDNGNNARYNVLLNNNQIGLADAPTMFGVDLLVNGGSSVLNVTLLNNTGDGGENGFRARTMAGTLNMAIGTDMMDGNDFRDYEFVQTGGSMNLGSPNFDPMMATTFMLPVQEALLETELMGLGNLSLGADPDVSSDSMGEIQLIDPALILLP